MCTCTIPRVRDARLTTASRSVSRSHAGRMDGSNVDRIRRRRRYAFVDPSTKLIGEIRCPSLDQAGDMTRSVHFWLVRTSGDSRTGTA